MYFSIVVQWISAEFVTQVKKKKKNILQTTWYLEAGVIPVSSFNLGLPTWFTVSLWLTKKSSGQKLGKTLYLKHANMTTSPPSMLEWNITWLIHKLSPQRSSGLTGTVQGLVILNWTKHQSLERCGNWRTLWNYGFLWNYGNRLDNLFDGILDTLGGTKTAKEEFIDV